MGGEAWEPPMTSRHHTDRRQPGYPGWDLSWPAQGREPEISGFILLRLSMSVYPSARCFLHILFIWYTEDDFLGIKLKGNAPLKAKFPQNQNLIIHFALLNSRETSGPRKSESIKKGDQELSQHEDWIEKLKIFLASFTLRESKFPMINKSKKGVVNNETHDI